MHFDNPQNWDTWTRSTRAHQAILTSLKAHRTDTHEQQLGSPMQVTLLTPSTTPSPELMQCDKVSTYVIPARRNQKHETKKEREQRQGICHQCGGKRHIEKCCPKLLMDTLKLIMHARAAPSVPPVQN
jgi:hypothetical protein